MGSISLQTAISIFSVMEKTSIVLPRGQLTHVLRHTFAAHFMMSGGNILALQKILGHHDIKMTMRYAHLAPDHLETALRFNPLANTTNINSKFLKMRILPC
ncbi:integrase [Escherichia coli]|uniref:Integrase n=1 Tax=Escherichia coli TaxID=562 RepID=A0A377F7V8_ECOLX|nr:integrase [Escherichia coli]